MPMLQKMKLKYKDIKLPRVTQFVMELRFQFIPVILTTMYCIYTQIYILYMYISICIKHIEEM